MEIPVYFLKRIYVITDRTEKKSKDKYNFIFLRFNLSEKKMYEFFAGIR